MRSLKSAWKDRRRRQLLARGGFPVEPGTALWSAGEGSARWSVDPRTLGERAVVYSFGIGRSLAFECALIERFGLQVHAFDPTPRALAWVRDQALPAGLAVHPIGLCTFDGRLSFRPPRRARSVNFRAAGRAVRDGDLLPVRTLATLMREHGHERLDVLKLDIEGGEVAVLRGLLARGGPPCDQLLVEFHHRPDGAGFAATREILQGLAAAGFELIAVSRRGAEFAFRRRV